MRFKTSLSGITIESGDFKVILHTSMWLAILFYGWWHDHMLFIVAIYTSVFLHELGHMYSGKYFGVKAEKIEISFLGGLLTMDEIKNPKHKIIMLFCGPLVNILIFLTLVGIFGIDEHIRFISTKYKHPNEVTDWLLSFSIFNMVMALFNLLPMFPLDGGQIMKSTFQILFKNTQISSNIAYPISIIFGIILLIYFIMVRNINGIIITVLAIFLNIIAMKTATKKLI